MILPGKHIKFGESIFGLSAVLLDQLKQEKNVEKLWSEFEQINNTDHYPVYQSYDNFILAIDLLFSMDLIGINKRGRLFKCN